MAEGGVRHRLILAVLLTVLVLTSIPAPASGASKPPCIQSSGSAAMAPLSAPAPPGVTYPCPGWDPTDYAVATTADVSGDGIEEVGLGIRIPATGDGIVFLIDGASAAVRWYTRVDVSVQDLVFLRGPDYLVAGSQARGNRLNVLAKLYALSLASGVLIWTSTVPGMAGGHADLMHSAEDANGDGVPDIAVGTDKGVLMVSGQSGAILWHVAKGTAVHQVASLGDIDGDEVSDVLATVHNNGCVLALSAANGKVLWKYTSWGGTCVADAFDLDMDGSDEVVVGMTGSSARVLILDGRTGAVRVSQAVPYPDWVAYEVVGSPDLDGDGIGDFVVANGTIQDSPTPLPTGCAKGESPCPGAVTAYSGADASPLWSDSSPMRPPKRLVRLPGEAGPTFVAGLGWGARYSLTEVFRLDAEGRRLWTFEVLPFSLPPKDVGILSVPIREWTNIVELVVGPDIDRSGTPDILAVSNNLRVYAISDSGVLLWAFLP